MELILRISGPVRHRLAAKVCGLALTLVAPAIFALTLVAMTAMAACGGGAVPTPSVEPAPEETGEEILARAVEQLLALESVSFTLEQLNGSTRLFPGLEMNKAYGVVEIPAKSRLTIEAETTTPRSYVELRIVTIGDDAYMTDILSGEWTQVPPDILPFSLLSLDQTLASIVGSVQSPALSGIESLGGVETYRVSGAVKSQDLSGIVPGAGTDFDVALELWLDRPHAVLRQVLITGKVVATDVPDAVRRLTLADVNVPVDITPPG